jgi:hypothetical protein
MRTNDTLRVFEYLIEFKANDCKIEYSTHRDINMVS